MATTPRDWPPAVYQTFQRPSVVRSTVGALLLIQTLLLAYSAYVHSPTANEPGHLVAGIINWQFARFDVYKVNPPLVRMIAAVPVVLSGPQNDWKSYQEGAGTRPEFAMGADFVAANSAQTFWLMTIARWACIPLALLGGYLCFRWSKELYGPPAGIVALTLWTFCPNILAHGALITPDLAATSLGLAACYTFWCWLKIPTWWHTAISGLVLGAAELAKTTLIIFYPLWPVLWILYRWPQRRTMVLKGWIRELAMLVVRTVIALYVINLGYGFEGSFTPLAKFQFVSSALTAETTDAELMKDENRFRGLWLGDVPIPLPKNYVLGIDLQRKDFERYIHPSYLGGQFREKGWWYYYLYALAVKVPLGTWILLCLATFVGLFTNIKVLWRDEVILLAPAIVILTFVSSQFGFSEHMRYVLPIFPFFFIWLSRVSVAFQRRGVILPAVIAAALAWSVGSSLWYYPHSLSYFNELVGGPIGGPKHLLHSNVDWGQDLLYLKKWLDQHPEAKPLKLAYFGWCNPKYAGIAYTVPECLTTKNADGSQSTFTKPIPPGWYAISANFIYGLPSFTFEWDGKKTDYEMNALSAFRDLKPVAMAGYSIYIYHVP